MKIRAIAFALPLVVGIAACKTSSSQGSTGSTASGSTTASTEGQGNAGQPQADQQTRGAAGPTASGDASAANKGGEASATATPGMGTSGSATGSADTSSGSATASGDVYTSPGTAGSTGTGTGTMSGDTGASASASGSMASGEDMKRHSDDKVVEGKLSKISSKSVTITTDDGTDKMLQVVPETTIQVDGQDARNSDLQEGQPVRASYSNAEGRDVAVEIHVGENLSGSSGSVQEPAQPSTTGSDTSTKPSDSSSPSPGSDRKY